ncbi:MAG TPA: NAD-dependent deacylase, partial [Burkholderiales bacterium]
ERAMHAASEADVFLAVGTSLQVYPIAGAFDLARSAGAKTVIINAEPTPYDAMADAVLPGSISEVLPKIVRGPGSASRSLR